MRKILFLIALSVISLTSISVASTHNFDVAKSLFEKGDYENAKFFFKKSCNEEGNSDACMYLKKYYHIDDKQDSISNSSNSGIFKITCSLKTNAKEVEDLEREMMMNDMAHVTTGNEPAWLKIFGYVAEGIATLATNIEHNELYCKYKGYNKESIESSDIFDEKLRTKKIIPVFLYEGLLDKFYEIYDYADIKETSNGEFIFKKNSIKSELKFFGFILRDENKILLWATNYKEQTLRSPTNQEWDEIFKDYLSDN